MKVISDRKIRLLNIEYDLFNGEDRVVVFDYLDFKYGNGKWRSRRSGPHPNKAGKGLVVAEAEI